MSYLCDLSLLTHSGVQHISCCCFCCVCLCPVSYVMCADCCQFLWIVHSCLPLRFSLTFIYITLKHGKESRQKFTFSTYF